MLMESVAGPKMPMPVKPFTVTLEPAPLMIMLLATRRSLAAGVLPTCSLPPLMTERVPPSTVTPWVNPLTIREPPLIVSPPPSQLHSERSPPIVPMLPPLLAPVSVSELLSTCSSEPAPENAPENVVLLVPAMVSMVVGSEAPMTTAPPPEAPSASEPIWALTPLPILSVAPKFTARAVWPGSAVLNAATSVPALMVVAPV